MQDLKQLSTELAEMTAVNDHVNALIKVAEYLELTRIASKLYFIRTKQENRGSLDHYDAKEKYELYSELMLAGNQSYGMAWNQVYQAL